MKYTDEVYNAAPSSEPERQLYFIDLCSQFVKLKTEELGRPLKYSVITFGCQMNAHDSEKLKGILDKIGYIESDDEISDFVIYNTCTIRENANQKLYGHLGHLKKAKNTNENMIVCLCGCMMQEKHVVEKIKASYSYVDIVFGTHNIYELAELIYKRLSNDEPVIEVLEAPVNTVEALPTKRKYSFKSGVNIMYGCNNFCSYCIVPYVRGRERSRTPEEILREINCLAEDGVKEVMLLGQNVNSYGTAFIGESEIINRNPDYGFPQLLNDVCKIPGIERVRFMTSHPKDLSDELIQVMADNKKVCRHLHLPVQSGSTEILKRMNRRYTKEQYLSLVERIQNKIPDISLTTDIIVGFPGETEEDFLDTLDVVEKVRYDQAFTFIYSKRTATPAAAMENQISPEVIKDRFDRLLKTVNKISAERAERFNGEIKEVLVEEINQKDENLLSGRTDNNLMVHFPGDRSLIGQIIKVKLNECKGFYYMGEVI